jgi:hypothetical protein
MSHPAREDHQVALGMRAYQIWNFFFDDAIPGVAAAPRDVQDVICRCRTRCPPNTLAPSRFRTRISCARDGGRKPGVGRDDRSNTTALRRRHAPGNDSKPGSRDLSAGLVVSGGGAQARAPEACAEFRHQPLRGEPGRPKNRIHVIEYRTVWNTSIITLRYSPQYFRANAYVLSQGNAGTKVSKQASHAGRFVEVSVTTGLNLCSG